MLFLCQVCNFSLKFIDFSEKEYCNLCYITLIRGAKIPPKAKITRDIIVDTTFKIAREDGAENINTHSTVPHKQLYITSKNKRY